MSMPCKYCHKLILKQHRSHRGYHWSCFNVKVNEMALEYKAMKEENTRLGFALNNAERKLKAYGNALESDTRQTIDEKFDMKLRLI